MFWFLEEWKEGCGLGCCLREAGGVGMVGVVGMEERLDAGECGGWCWSHCGGGGGGFEDMFAIATVACYIYCTCLQ